MKLMLTVLLLLDRVLALVKFAGIVIWTTVLEGWGLKMDEADVVAVDSELLRFDVAPEGPAETLDELPLGLPVVVVDALDGALVDASVDWEDVFVDEETDTTVKAGLVGFEREDGGCSVADVVAFAVSEVDALDDPIDATGTTVTVSGTPTVVL